MSSLTDGRAAGRAPFRGPDRVLPMKLTEPAYMVDVDIERQHIATAHGRRAALRPDMLLAASVEVDRSSLLSWIGESVFGIAQR
jgi:hypothetical protein